MEWVEPLALLRSRLLVFKCTFLGAVDKPCLLCCVWGLFFAK